MQLTHKPEYVEVVAMLEKTAEQYKEEALETGSEEAKDKAYFAREAATAIKKDPSQVANPKYAFLTSAAHMKKQGADVSAGKVKPGDAWTGADAASGWVAGGLQKKGSDQANALADKGQAYADIYRVLMREATKKPAAGSTP